ncbi:MAG TPA: ATP-binding cassette domain-containing protein [Actinomycetes bacterium]|nr:ATP-binding cassette domain-containing protein [Actinomycetes bacterium]
MTVPAPAPSQSGQPADDEIVVVDQLVKRYPKLPFNAVDGVSFGVRRGEVFGLLGPNGAGKTTTIGVLTTRVRPTAGRALVTGIDVARDPVGAKRALAVVPQLNNLDRSLSARRNLLFHAAYFGIPEAERLARADRLLHEFGLADRADDKVHRFSGGQAQRLMIARALMHDPQVLFLDEPTTGLDPQARLFVWDRIRGQRERGVSVLLTTHDMDEAAELADRVGIMDHGKLLALDTPDALTALVPGQSTLELGIQPDGAGPEGIDGLATALSALPGVERVERVQRGPAGPAHPTAGGFPGGGPPFMAAAPATGNGGGGLHLRLYCEGEAAGLVPPVVRAIGERGATLADLRLGRPSLEDVFIHLTGRGLRG